MPHGEFVQYFNINKFCMSWSSKSAWNRDATNTMLHMLQWISQ